MIEPIANQDCSDIEIMKKLLLNKEYIDYGDDYDLNIFKYGILSRQGNLIIVQL